MARLQYSVRYQINGLWVSPDVLGWEHHYQRGDDQVTLELPENNDHFTARPHETELEPVPSWTQANTFREPESDNDTRAVNLYAIHLEFDAPLDHERPPSLSVNEDYWNQARAACEYALPICETSAWGFLRWLRASSRQPWLGLLAEQPRQYGRGGLYYADDGRGVMGHGPTWSQQLRSPKLRMELDEFFDLGVRVSDGDEVPVTAELLSDARYLDEGAQTPDMKRAVLTATTACEVRTSEVLTERVHPDRAALLKMLMDRTSTLPFMLGDLMLAAFDMSLRTDDLALFERVRLLAKERNKVAHEGAEVDAAAVGYRPAQVAVDLFAWLDSNVR